MSTTRQNYSDFNIRNYIIVYPDLNQVITEYADGENPEKVVNDLFTCNSKRIAAQSNLYGWFKGEDVPVYARQLKIGDAGQIQKNKINNKINHDFFGEIATKKGGYLSGKSAAVSLERSTYPVPGKAKKLINKVTGKIPLYDEHSKLIKDFEKRSNMKAVRLNNTTYGCLYGLTGRLIEADSNNNQKVSFIHGFKCVWLSESNSYLDAFAAAYMKNEYLAYYFTKTEKIKFVRPSGAGSWSYSETEKHYFGNIPLIPFMNNEPMTGDIQNTVAKVWDYDGRASDLSSEINSERLKLMVLKDINIKPDQVTEFEQVGVLKITTTADGKGSVEFPNKNFNTESVEKLLERTREEILKDGKSVDFKQLAGVSGDSKKWNLLTMENNATATEASYSASEMRMYEMFATYWNRFNSGKDLDYLNINIEYTRNLPVEIGNIAETLQKLHGIVPTKIMFTLFPELGESTEIYNAYLEEFGDPSRKVDITKIDFDGVEETEEEDVETE